MLMDSGYKPNGLCLNLIHRVRCEYQYNAMVKPRRERVRVASGWTSVAGSRGQLLRILSPKEDAEYLVEQAVARHKNRKKDDKAKQKEKKSEKKASKKEKKSKKSKK